jgi:uncharacterized protein (DUF934 family)
MPLVKNGQIIEDRFVLVLDDAPVPEEGAVLIPAARFLSDSADFVARSGPTGVAWPNNRKVSELAPHLDRLALIALVFPNFRDGRAYSQARVLRERYGFHGELRATGEVLRDQFLFLVRAGFDTFETKKETDAQAFAESVARYSVFYQPTGVALPSAGQLRLARPNWSRPDPARGLDRLQAVR